MAAVNRYRSIDALLVWVLAGLLGLSVMACGPHSTLPEGEEVLIKGTTFSFDNQKYPSPHGLFPDYQLVPGDVLDVLFQIQTWSRKDQFQLAVNHTVSVKFVNAPTLNDVQQVQPDGRISLPYLGPIMAAGKTVPDLTAELKQRYSRILRNPVELYVMVPDFSQNIKELKSDLHTAPRGLSRLVTIRPDGICTFPLVGDLFVATRTIPEVKQILDAKYEKYLPGLNVDLFLETHSGLVVYVMGQVPRGGSFNIKKPISVMEAIALAGGFNNEANQEEVMVFRKCQKDRVATKVNMEATSVASKDSVFYYLQPDDIVYVPRLKRSTWAQIMREVGDIIFFRGWGSSIDGVLFNGALIDLNTRR